MTEREIEALLTGQREYYKSGATLSIEFRIRQLKRLYGAVKQNEKKIAAALYADLGKSGYEGFMCEIGNALTEIRYLIKHVRRFMRERRVRTPLAQFAARSYVKPIPYGSVLIMSPWNYPFLLTVEPLADAIAAGNTVILKPSAYAPETSRVIADMIAECFDPAYVAVVTGGRQENAALLDLRFDLIFFTGSKEVGREVLRRAAEHLTPAVLELGGKSPCIVDRDADIALAARRIVFGKYLNCGQTCVAPDYVLCAREVLPAFTEAVKREVVRQYGEKPLENADYGRIVNEKHFNRLCALIDPARVVIGGDCDPEALRIAPTVMCDITREDAVMREEIFGPILPILTFDDFDRVVDGLKTVEKPLALYLFTKDKRHVRRVTNELSYGGGCVNDVVIHLATSEMGFGGVGESGMGSYHGRAGFEAFSHRKSIVDKKTWIDLPMRYAPYRSRFRERLLRMFLK